MAKMGSVSCYYRSGIELSRVHAIGENWRQNVYRSHEGDGDFFSSHEWHEIRDGVLRRDHYKCERCDNRRHSELTIHHIKSRDQGGTHDLSNLITLCDRCHNIVEIDETLTSATLIRESLYQDDPLPLGAKYRVPKDEQGNPDWHSW